MGVAMMSVCFKDPFLLWLAIEDNRAVRHPAT